MGSLLRGVASYLNCELLLGCYVTVGTFAQLEQKVTSRMTKQVKLWSRVVSEY